MSETVINVENLSKSYLIRHQQIERNPNLGDVLVNGVKGIGNRLLRRTNGHADASREEFWALNDVSFEVKQGERVGIIGRNGAGKSTLLKILSRITEPTKGRIHIKGRVASLLEVGTGFHPELTGRENIYLNGAILGMSREEIRRKFDEIVAFAEVEKFLDTPVKRYSSGMYVRLAFAVAAHLEPEILVVDEVLAVGDAQFQKRCLGKMENVAKQGRTIIFVSHNMAAIQKLCERVFLLSKGNIIEEGPSHEVAHTYLLQSEQLDNMISLSSMPRSFEDLGKEIRINNCSILNAEGIPTTYLQFGEPFSVNIGARADVKLQDMSVLVRIDSFSHEPLVVTGSENSDLYFTASPSNPLQVIAHIHCLILVPGMYWLTPSIRSGKRGLDQIPQAVRFEVLTKAYEKHNPYLEAWGHIQAQSTWESQSPSGIETI